MCINLSLFFAKLFVQCLVQLHPPLRKNDLKEDQILGKILDVLTNNTSSKVRCCLDYCFEWMKCSLSR